MMGDPRQNYDVAAELLWRTLKAQTWFVGIERDEGVGFIVEWMDKAPADEWCVEIDGSFHGWPVGIRRGRAQAMRGKKP